MPQNKSHFSKADLVDAIEEFLISEGVQLLGKGAVLSSRQVTRMVDASIKTLTEAMQSGNVVDIRGFGRFDVVTRGARMGRNPRTGEAMKVPTTRTVRFRASEPLRKKLSTAGE